MLFVMVQRVRVAIIFFLVDVIHKSVWDDLDKIKVILHIIFRKQFKFFNNFAISLEHIEHRMLPIIYISKSFLNYFLLTLVTKCNLVDTMIYLHLVFFFSLSFLFCVFLELMQSFWMTFLFENKLTCDLNKINRSSYSTFQILIIEILNQISGLNFIVQINIFEGLQSWKVINNLVILPNMVPAQLACEDFFIYLVYTGSHKYFYQEAWKIWEFDV